MGSASNANNVCYTHNNNKSLCIKLHVAILFFIYKQRVLFYTLCESSNLSCIMSVLCVYYFLLFECSFKIAPLF